MHEFSYLPPEIFIYCFVLGLLIGLVTSTLGIGGGIFMVPLLPIIFKMTLHEAVATSLFTIFLVTLFNTFIFHRQKAVRWPVGLWLGVPASVVAFFIPTIAVRLPEVAIQFVLVVALFAMSVVTYHKRRALTQGTLQDLDRRSKIRCVGLGSVVGALSGLSGLGGGLFFGPFLISQRLVLAQQLTPTINLTAMLTTVMGTVGYLIMGFRGTGYIHFPLAFALFLVASLSGVYFKKLQPMIPVHWKATIIAAVLLVMAANVLIKAQL